VGRGCDQTVQLHVPSRMRPRSRRPLGAGNASCQAAMRLAQADHRLRSDPTSTTEHDKRRADRSQSAGGRQSGFGRLKGRWRSRRVTTLKWISACSTRGALPIRAELGEPEGPSVDSLRKDRRPVRLARAPHETASGAGSCRERRSRQRAGCTRMPDDARGSFDVPAAYHAAARD